MGAIFETIGFNLKTLVKLGAMFITYLLVKITHVYI